MKKHSWMWSGLLVVGLAFGGASVARADEAPSPPPKKEGKKAKTGEACKDNSDCDQSGPRQSCRGGKCEVQRTPVPT